MKSITTLIVAALLFLFLLSQTGVVLYVGILILIILVLGVK